MSQKDDDSPATKRDLHLMHGDFQTQMLHMRTDMHGLRTDMHDMMKVFMGAIGDLETRLSIRMDDMEERMATKDDLEDFKHQLLLSDEQTRRDVADMYNDKFSSHDDRITKLELVTGLKAA